jgi:uncharacterized membrane protein (UPF0136 family)
MHLLAFFFSVLAAAALGAGGIYLSHTLLPPGTLAGVNDVIGGYIQTVGTVYGVLLAFVVFVVWTQYNEAAGFTDREANDLFDLFRIAGGFAEPVRTFLMSQLHTYAVAIIGVEWGRMRRGGECERARGALEAVWGTLEQLEPSGPREQALYREALMRFNDLSDTRTDRLRASRTHIPFVLWMLLILGAFVVVGSMALFDLPSVRLHALITAALSGAIAHIVYVVYDLDHCFWGSWSITAEPFQRVRVRMEEQLAREASRAVP